MDWISPSLSGVLFQTGLDKRYFELGFRGFRRCPERVQPVTFPMWEIAWRRVFLSNSFLRGIRMADGKFKFTFFLSILKTTGDRVAHFERQRSNVLERFVRAVRIREHGTPQLRFAGANQNPQSGIEFHKETEIGHVVTVP